MLVFSSALRTQSAGDRGWPAQTPWDTSSTRPAFAANCGSRGVIQLRCRQGLSASASRMRQIVLALSAGAPAWASMERTRSAVLERLSGCSRRAGSSPARAFTVATARGGKRGPAPTPRLVGQAAPLARPGAPPAEAPVHLAAEALRELDEAAAWLKPVNRSSRQVLGRFRFCPSSAAASPAFLPLSAGCPSEL